MKAILESEKLQHRGVELHSENHEEAQVLHSLWVGHCRASVLTHKLDGNIILSVVPTLEGD
jgi:hypothetical protein